MLQKVLFAEREEVGVGETSGIWYSRNGTFNNTPPAFGGSPLPLEGDLNLSQEMRDHSKPEGISNSR